MRKEELGKKSEQVFWILVSDWYLNSAFKVY